MTVMMPQRHRATAKKPMWIIVLLSMVCIVLIGAYVFPPRRFSKCYLSASSVCTNFKDWLPSMGRRERTDEEIISSVVIRDILSMPMPVSKNPKIALMFLTPGSLPFEKLWEKFLQYVLLKYEYITLGQHVDSPMNLHLIEGPKPVVWGLISMVDAEKRLLANALEDVDNQVFVLLSDSCVPLHSFDYVYNYLMGTNVSFVDCFKDPGPHGSGRYSPEMYPEIDKRILERVPSGFAVTRRHALMILADSLYYKKFKLYCKICAQIYNWSVTNVDWSDGKMESKVIYWSEENDDVTYDLLKNITAIDENFHVTSDDKKLVMQKPCLWNGSKRPCYLFARKFNPEALDNLLKLFTSYTSV
ncbi:unnamed protein product [Miscanthus lutarioriparius]|uniref:Core-2/I-branching beta-1,6-N-acetylglucosaminyltransferase family protein n=1 Tax=Miscanthus lutarioriparius TaxID=422564 RepID=A0A811S3G9_9POAL|nr:unnamed protein product [Miscanthus lutarioriparius]